MLCRRSASGKSLCTVSFEYVLINKSDGFQTDPKSSSLCRTLQQANCRPFRPAKLEGFIAQNNLLEGGAHAISNSTNDGIPGRRRANVAVAVAVVIAITASPAPPTAHSGAHLPLAWAGIV
jgi:hypothetical protein